MQPPCRGPPIKLVCNQAFNLLPLLLAGHGHLPNSQAVILTANQLYIRGREKLSSHHYQTPLRDDHWEGALSHSRRGEFLPTRLRATSSVYMSVKNHLLPTRRHLVRKEAILMTREDPQQQQRERRQEAWQQLWLAIRQELRQADRKPQVRATLLLPMILFSSKQCHFDSPRLTESPTFSWDKVRQFKQLLLLVSPPPHLLCQKAGLLIWIQILASTITFTSPHNRLNGSFRKAQRPLISTRFRCPQWLLPTIIRWRLLVSPLRASLSPRLVCQ
jgi:hypothetical protein